MYLYCVYDEQQNPIYYEYRLEYAFSFFKRENRAKKLYIVTKTLKKFKALGFWKDANDCIFLLTL